jgi:PadR family transcriptional regulator
MTSSQRSDLPQGTLVLLILRIAAVSPIHGYAIALRIQEISRDVLQVHPGSLYPALHHLENRGFLSGEWKASETGRATKFYHLTSKGRTQLKAETEHWKRLSAAIGLILREGRRRSSMNWWRRLRSSTNSTRSTDSRRPVAGSVGNWRRNP